MSSKHPNIGALYGSQPTASFLGLPSCSDIGKLDAEIAIVAAGCATPYPSVGAYCGRRAGGHSRRNGELVRHPLAL